MPSQHAWTRDFFRRDCMSLFVGANLVPLEKFSSASSNSCSSSSASPRR